MSIVEIKYEAKCKDCKHYYSNWKGKRKRYFCGNPKSPFNGSIAKSEKACRKFEF